MLSEFIGAIVSYGKLSACSPLGSDLMFNVLLVVVMISITGAQRDILLNPIGNQVWSGQVVQSLNSVAITWSLAKELYGPSGPYFVIPMGILIGFAATFVHWLIHKVKASEYLFHVTQGSDSTTAL
jgi:OPT oligopeptide transporter protein